MELGEKGEIGMKRFLLGLICGIGMAVLVGALLMPQVGRLFFVEDRSLLPFDETVEQIREHCQQNPHWHITQEKDYNAAYAKRGKGELPFRLTEFKLGNPDHSYRINKEYPAVCTFMPAAIAVVEYKPEDVRIYRKNTGFMGRMFTGSVKEVMQYEVPRELDQILSGIIEKNTPAKNENE